MNLVVCFCGLHHTKFYEKFFWINLSKVSLLKLDVRTNTNAIDGTVNIIIQQLVILLRSLELITPKEFLLSSKSASLDFMPLCQTSCLQVTILCMNHYSLSYCAFTSPLGYVQLCTILLPSS
jgi:hypothetical protein